MMTGQWRQNDLLVFVSCRSGSIAWQPGLDRLPLRFAQQYPQGSLLVVYPTDTPGAAWPAAKEPWINAPSWPSAVGTPGT